MNHTTAHSVPLLLLLGLVSLFASTSRAAGAPAGSGEPLELLCTIPDIADIVQRIGADEVHIVSIAKGTENVHAVRLKPSHIVAASRADGFFEIGLSLEHAWVPGLLQTARNERIQPGAKGFAIFSRGWQPIEIPPDLSRKRGTDLHPEGNPHLNLAQGGGRHMAQVAREVLVALRPEQKPLFDANLQSYLGELDAAEARWRALAERVRGTKVVTYHSDFDYLLQGLGMQLAGTIEVKPGVPPTPRHIAELSQTMRAESVELVLVSSWVSQREAQDLCAKTGAELVELPAMVGAEREAKSWIAMMDTIHARIAKALGQAWPVKS